MDLVPDIAYGNLATSSLAEVLAAAFRANATGTIAVEQGKGESRVYVQYGSPCGTAVLNPTRTFGDYLVSVEVLEKERVVPLSNRAEQRKVNLSALLIDEKILPADQVLSLLAAYHHEELVALCLVREGKYELRGWERPPDWTESIHLDPLRAIITALSAEQLADRKQAIISLIDERTVGISTDFEDLAGRLFVDDADVQAIQVLRTPMQTADYLKVLGGAQSEAAVAAYAILGLIDEPADQPVFDPASPIQIDEQIAFPVTVEEMEEQRPSSPRPSGPTLGEEDAVDVQFDIEPAAETRAAPQPFFEDHVVYDESVSAWSDDMSNRLDEALVPQTSPEGEGFTTLPQGIPPPASGPASFVSGLSDATEPVSTLRANESRGLFGQVEFEPLDTLDSLELDLKRAPKEILRASLERDSRLRPARDRAVGTDPILPRARVSTTGSTDPSVPTIVGRGSARAPATRTGAAAVRTQRAEEYNPFRPHFRKRTAPAAAASADPLEDALERALRGAPAPAAVQVFSPTTESIEEPVEPSTIPRLSPPLTEPPTMVGQPLGMQDSPLGDIAAAIESSVGPDFLSEDTGPLDISATPAPMGSGDGLALDVARSDTVEEDVTAFIEGADEPPTDPYGESPSGRQEKPISNPGAQAPAEDRPREDRADVRRRMLQRAMRNVSSGPFAVRSGSSTGSHAVVKEEPDPFKQPQPEAAADPELEKDLKDRSRKASGGDHFATLDLSHDAGTDQVKAAFLELAKKYHPDRLSSLGQTHLLPAARDVFAQVKEAYDVLLDPASRARHLSALEAKSGVKKRTGDDAKSAYQRALVYLKRKDFKQAEAELVRAIDVDAAPDYLAELAWTLLSNPQRRDDAIDEAKSLMAKALKGGNLSDRVLVVAAHIARIDGDTVRMEKFFRSALEKNPKNVEAARELRLIEMRRPAEKPAGLLERLRKKS